MVTVISVSSGLLGYRLEAEKAYCEVIVEQIREGQELAQDARDVKLAPIRRQNLAQYDLDASVKVKNEREIYSNLLRYYQQVRDFCQQQIWHIYRARLRQERLRLNLSRSTARAINLMVRWAIYDQQLFVALQQDHFSLTTASRRELSQWQRALAIPNRRIPPAELLRSGRKVNYIRLWRRLNEQGWLAANHETHQCLLAASGQQGKSLQLIDVERIADIDLKTIDFLWRQHSIDRSGVTRFGFSIQLEIWQAAIKNGSVDVEEFSKQVGWRRIHSWINHESLDYSLDAERGHLPALPYMGWWCWVGGMEAVMNRMKQIHTD
jgi:hypothetical protein